MKNAIKTLGDSGEKCFDIAREIASSEFSWRSAVALIMFSLLYVWFAFVSGVAVDLKSILVEQISHSSYCEIHAHSARICGDELMKQ